MEWVCPHGSHLSVLLQGFRWPWFLAPMSAAKPRISWNYLRGLLLKVGSGGTLIVSGLCLPLLTSCLWLYAPAAVGPKSSQQPPHGR